MVHFNGYESVDCRMKINKMLLCKRRCTGTLTFLKILKNGVTFDSTNNNLFLKLIPALGEMKIVKLEKKLKLIVLIIYATFMMLQIRQEPKISAPKFINIFSDDSFL